MKYSVKVYMTVYQTIEVDAQDHDSAITTATDLFWQQPELSKDLEFADEITGYLVDEDGDEEHENSKFYDRHGRPNDNI